MLPYVGDEAIRKQVAIVCKASKANMQSIISVRHFLEFDAQYSEITDCPPTISMPGSGVPVGIRGGAWGER